MDKFNQIAWAAQLAVVVLGNGSEFELVDVSAGPLSETRNKSLQERGFGFVGVVGMVNGAPRCAFALPFDDATVEYIAAKFALFVDERSNKTKGDSVEWLTRLYQLPDTRNGVS
jgi:hypothetical protein